MIELPPYPPNMILLVEVGSTAYGTGIAGGEDHDEMGIVVETREEVCTWGEGFGTKVYRTKPEGVRSEAGDTDRQLHSLRKYLHLAEKGNPSILVGFWAPVIESSYEGDLLRSAGPLFISRAMIPRFRGYMQSQCLRLLGLKGSTHGRRGGGGRQELIEKHGYDCYLDDTEFLTNRGWLRYDEITEFDSLGTVEPQTGEIAFQQYTERVAKPYSGPLMRGASKHTAWAVTPNHRMLRSRVNRGPSGIHGWRYDSTRAEWGFGRADEMTNGTWHVRVAGQRTREEFPVKDEYLSLLGAYASEGCVGKRLQDGTPSVLRFDQKDGGDFHPIMATISERWPTRQFREEKRSMTTWSLANREIAASVVKDCGERSAYKRLPAWISQLSTEQARILLTALLAGDGTTREGGYVYYTKSRRLADDVQVLGVIAGMRTHLWGPYDDMFQVRLVEGAVMTVAPQHHAVEHVEGQRIVCFTVPNETLITRRDGKVAMHGNTKFAMHAARLGFQCIELLETGMLSMPIRSPEGDWLRDVRYGKVPFDDWWEQVLFLDNELNRYMTVRDFPEKANRQAIRQLSVRIHEKVWAG